MLTFLTVSIVLLLIACGLFSSGSEGPSLLSGFMVMLVLIIGAFWYFGDDPSAAIAMVGGGSGPVSISRATW